MSNKTILFADDSATMRTIMEKTFLAEPFDVVTVPSGEAAIGQAKKIRPNVIVVDAGMSGVSGYDVCKAVRDDTAIGKTPLIIMSGVSSLYDESRGEAVGVTEHVKKPFDTNQLIELITELSGSVDLPDLDDLPEVEEITPISEAPEPVAELESISEPPLEPIDDLPETADSLLPEVQIESDDGDEPALEAAASLSSLDVEQPVHRRTGTGTREFGRPAFLKQAASPKTDAVSREKVAPAKAENSDYGEMALGVPDNDLEPAEEVAPIELGTPKTDADSQSFQVGTLAELAQMDGQGRPLEPEPVEEAIELKTPTKPAGKPTEVTAQAPSPAPTAESRFAGSEAAKAVRDRVADAAKDVAGRVEGITVEQAEAIQTLTREVIERVVWEVVPDLAEVIIKEELTKLLEE